ncbi:hypothetical protein PLEOSDRAFT_1108784 [Pleurotus ostreatus PC15]|uniref:C2H2-type domain-containing protein n=1 Tax=Pleurotus ostreatus (strain PC15) TaxID=1137138 RepID=A0A067N537_PLEO1|nr:hypothetical protein PLEOSDRAFT_1108784 [Pleurotus ostreatus PC15]
MEYLALPGTVGSAVSLPPAPSSICIPNEEDTMWSMRLIDELAAEEHKPARGPALSYAWNEGPLPPLEQAQNRLGLPLFVAQPVEPSVPKAPTPAKVHKKIIYDQEIVTCECGKVGMRGVIRRHQKRKCPNKIPVGPRCPDCQRVFSSNGALRQHRANIARCLKNVARMTRCDATPMTPDSTSAPGLGALGPSQQRTSLSDDQLQYPDDAQCASILDAELQYPDDSECALDAEPLVSQQGTFDAGSSDMVL